MASKWISPCLLIVACITGFCPEPAHGVKDYSFYRPPQEIMMTDRSVRKRLNIERFSDCRLEKFRTAIQNMKNDGTYHEIATYHGYPFLCTDECGCSVQCCPHGREDFPHWHRLYMIQFEGELLKHNWTLGLPYWDWTMKMNHLPDAVNEPFFVNCRGVNMTNPLFQGVIYGLNVSTSRDPYIFAFNSDFFLNQVLLALEQTDYCKFEVQFENVHNALHNFVGGSQNISMSEVKYAAFDPIFFLHHSFVDKIWAIWQALQKDRDLPDGGKDCNETVMHDPMMPFANKSINKDETTFAYRYPDNVTDYEQQLHYKYDNLGFHTMTYEQVKEAIILSKSRDRLFALIHLPTYVSKSVFLEVYLCIRDSGGKKDCSYHAGDIAIFGGGFRMGIVSSRQLRFDVSHVIQNLGLALTDHANFDVLIRVRDTKGSHLDTDLYNFLPKPSLLFLQREVGTPAPSSSSSFISTGFLLLVSMTLLVTATAF